MEEADFNVMKNEISETTHLHVTDIILNNKKHQGQMK